jgi:hypothetical protein
MSQPSHSPRLRHAEDDPFKFRSGDPESGRHATVSDASPHSEVLRVAELVIGQETLLSLRDYRMSELALSCCHRSRDCGFFARVFSSSTLFVALLARLITFRLS